MIQYFCEDIAFELSSLPSGLVSYLEDIAIQHHFTIEALNFIFCSDPYLLKINQDYLQHDYFTDVITFDHAEAANLLMGDIYISIDRVQENAHSFGVTFLHELLRVMMHGLLHLLGYDDKQVSLQKLMRQREDHYLSLYLKEIENQ